MRQRRRIVGAIATHGDKLALGLLVTDELQLCLRRGLGKKIVDTGFGRDRSRRHRIVARDHDGADAHASKLGKTLADAALDHVFQMYDAKQATVAGHGERRTASLGDVLGDCLQLLRALRIHPRTQGPDGADMG